MADNSDAVTSGSEYSTASIKKTVWGGISPAPDGEWFTTWHLEMDTSGSLIGETEIEHNQDLGFFAVLKVLGDGSSVLSIRTSQDPMSAEYYPLTFKCFRIINDEIGNIRTIQGLPRDWYAPFRSR